MRTACVLRRTWAHLHTVFPRSEFNCAPLQNLRTFVGPEQRFFSASPGFSVLPARGLSVHTALAYGSTCSRLKTTCWSAYLIIPQSGSGNLLAPELYRTAGNGSLSSDGDDDENESAWPWTTSIYRKCKEFYTSPKTLLGSELESYRIKLQKQDTHTPNEFGISQREKEERRQPTSWNEIGCGGPKNDCSDILSSPSTTGLFLRKTRMGHVVAPSHFRSYSSGAALPPKSESQLDSDSRPVKLVDYSQRAVVTALWCNFLVLSLKLGVWIMTSSHVMLAEAIHSLADLANQGLIAYGLMSSRRAPDALHPYGYSKERFVWSLISAVGIFCLGSGATIIHGVQNLWTAEPLENAYLAALVVGGSMIMEGASLLVAISCVRNGAKAEGMTLRDYLWRGHDPTSVAVMMEDGAAVTGLAIAGLALTAVHFTGNPMWDPIGSIVVGNLLGAVAIFLIQRNRHALLGRSMDEHDMRRVLDMLCKDPVVDAVYDCKSEVIGPGAYRFKAEIDFNGVTIVQNYIRRAGRGSWQKEFHDAVSSPEPGHLDRVMAAYGEEVVSALGSEVDRLEREIQKVVPGILHVDIEAHNPNGPAPRERLYFHLREKKT